MTTKPDPSTITGLWRAAMLACHESGLSWHDPRTGIEYPPPVAIVGLEGAMLVKKHFIELAAEMAPAAGGTPVAEPALTVARIRELRTNYAERTLKGNRSDLFGTDDERDELCRLALLALGVE